MTFASHPWIIVFLLALPVLVIFFYRSEMKKLNMLSHFAASNLLASLADSYSSNKRKVKVTLTIAGILFIMIALSRPQWGHHWQETKGRGIDILIALDTSKSMLAEDIKPNRLERAKFAVFDLVKKLEGDRVGLIAFSGQAFLQCPLTLDYDAFNQTLEIIDTGTIPVGGTNIASAIREASASFAHDDNYKILVMITDGEDLHSSGIELARKASAEGVKIFTVGVGSAEGELIPVKQANGEVVFLRDHEGNVVKSKLDTATMMDIANATDAFYVPLGSTGQGLELVYEKGLQSIPKQEREARLNKIPQERFQWPLGLALLAFFIDSLLGTRRHKRGSRSISFIGMAMLLFTLLLAQSLPLSGSPQKAGDLYEKGEFEKAGNEYRESIDKNPEDSRLYYNLGASLYRSADYDQAQEALDKALASENLSLQESAFYNLGNTHYRMGESQLENNPQETIALWEQGLKDYENAINLNSEDEDAKFNHAFLKKRLVELKKQQQQQQQEQEDNQEQNSQDSPDSEEQEEPSQPERIPGSMTREEARQLLDALKDGEKKLPAAFLENPEEPMPQENEIIMDW